MRIALTGSSSTGKTTLARAFNLRNPEVCVLNVDARSILDAMHIESCNNMTPNVYSVFQRRYIATKIKNERGRSRYITERSFVDSYAYWVLNCSCSYGDRLNSQVWRICKYCAERYDKHLLLPYGLVPHCDDGYRQPDPVYHKEIEGIIINTLNSWGITYEILYEVDMTYRLKVLEESFRR